jgi:hypothetical protein
MQTTTAPRTSACQLRLCPGAAGLLNVLAITITITKVGPLAHPVRSQTWLVGSSNILAQPKGEREAEHTTDTHAIHNKWGPAKELEYIATAQVAGESLSKQ